MRADGRKDDQLREVRIIPGFIPHAEGSALVEWGNTKVIVTATVEEKIPSFLKGSGSGWVTAEYGMLPRSTHSRMQRESSRGRQGGRTMEIQRLIGRSLRSVTDLRLLGERTLLLDCDVIQADGGTRVASVTGAFVALYLALKVLHDRKKIREMPMDQFLAAVSVGIVEGRPVLDLCYQEDSSADTDMNVVMTAAGGIIEVQGTAEKEPFSRELMDELMDLAEKGIGELTQLQRKVIFEHVS